MKEKEQGMDINHALDDANTGSIPEKVQDVYAAVGELLSHYRSGKLPKAVKVLPHLKNWEDILVITNPSSWTAAGTYAITKVFASNLNVKLVQRFLNVVLLDKCRYDIEEHEKLNFHLYNALKKALFKPAAFYKGLLLPLLQSGCTQKEAIIFGSVISKMSIPAIHSAAALLRILELPYSTAHGIIIKQLLMKKYAFPPRVVDKVVEFFITFRNGSSEQPVIWHQMILAFVQRYKHQLTSSQRDEILGLIRIHQHREISAEIQRELLC